MVVYSFYIFDRHSTFPSPLPALKLLTCLLLAQCIFAKAWPSPATTITSTTTSTTTGTETPAVTASSTSPSLVSDDAKLLFGVVFSLRNMARKLGGDDDAFISYRTAQYKLHFYETPASLRFVLLTDTTTLSMRNVLHQIYINLWVEYGTSPHYSWGNGG